VRLRLLQLLLLLPLPSLRSDLEEGGLPVLSLLPLLILPELGMDEDDADDNDSCDRLMGEGDFSGDGNGDSVGRKGCGEEEEEDSVSLPAF
jgi:hypothetical protein